MKALLVEGSAYEGTAQEGTASDGWLNAADATAAIAWLHAYEERKGIGRCRAANAQCKRARQSFRSLYFTIYIGRRQATFLQLIRGVTEL
jgi:hypothetical protein